jgi:cytochrome c oxidase cbb3-type subunit 2
MKELAPLVLGIFGTFTFSWVALTVIPNLQIGHYDPQMDEEGADAYPVPRSGMAERGRRVYAANGCMYCHSQQVRPDYAGADLERKWGQRRSAPRDYIFDRPVMLGKMRLGPDLANVGHRPPPENESAPPPGATNTTTAGQPAPATAPGASPAAAAAPAPPGSLPAAAQPSPPAPGPGQPAASPPPANPNVPNASTSSSPHADAAAQSASPTPTAAAEVTTTINGNPLPYSSDWHHRHLYNPRSITPDSIMPSYRFLYSKRKVDGERSAEVLKFVSRDAPEEGWEIIPTYDAQCLVAYLMSLDQSHALKEVKAATPPSSALPGKAPGK